MRSLYRWPSVAWAWRDVGVLVGIADTLAIVEETGAVDMDVSTPGVDREVLAVQSKRDGTRLIGLQDESCSGLKHHLAGLGDWWPLLIRVKPRFHVRGLWIAIMEADNNLVADLRSDRNSEAIPNMGGPDWHPSGFNTFGLQLCFHSMAIWIIGGDRRRPLPSLPTKMLVHDPANKILDVARHDLLRFLDLALAETVIR